MKNLTVVKEKLGQRYLQAATVATVGALPLMAHAEGTSMGIDPTMIKTIVDGIGMPALIGAAVASMLAIAVLIWGGKKVIGFFGK